MASSSATSRSTTRKKSRSSRPSPRQRLLHSATHLFTTEGIRVIGIDRILREADVAKASLYSLFGSKDALVVAYLQELDHAWRQRWQERTEALETPEEKILAFFDQFIDELPAENYRGSHFQNAASEYPRPETELERNILAAVTDHRRWCHATITRLLEARNGYPSSDEAHALLIFLDGGIAGARLDRSIEPLVTARGLAKERLSAPAADYSI